MELLWAFAFGVLFLEMVLVLLVCIPLPTNAARGFIVRAFRYCREHDRISLAVKTTFGEPHIPALESQHQPCPFVRSHHGAALPRLDPHHQPPGRPGARPDRQLQHGLLQQDAPVPVRARCVANTVELGSPFLVCCRNQRNAYITGFSVFLFIVLYRLAALNSLVRAHRWIGSLPPRLILAWSLLRSQLHGSREELKNLKGSDAASGKKEM